MDLKEWKYRKDIPVIPGVSVTYGRGGIAAAIKNNFDIEFEADKLRNTLFRPYASSDEIRSKDTSSLTSRSLEHFKQLLVNSYTEYDITSTILTSRRDAHSRIGARRESLQKSLFRFFFKKKIEKLVAEETLLAEEIDELKEQLSCAIILLEINTEETFSDLYGIIYKAFSILTLSQKKWDVTSSKVTNQFAERTSATSTITRSEIDIDFTNLSLINYQEKAIRFKNMNGGDLYFFPGFLIFHESKTSFAIIDYTDLSVEFRLSKFIEEQQVPSDTKVIGQTWLKVNKDGSPDRRFSNNYQIPVVCYGEVHFKSSTGLNEVYSFSNCDAAELFAKAMSNYLNALKAAKSLIDAFNN